MNRYTLYCTETQTRKAFKLGAPIRYIRDEDGALSYDLDIPTAEQMLCWLEEQGIAVDLHTYFSVNSDKIHHYQYTVTDFKRVFNGEYNSHKEATLAAIDTALEYLIKNKK